MLKNIIQCLPGCGKKFFLIKLSLVHLCYIRKIIGNIYQKSKDINVFWLQNFISKYNPIIIFRLKIFAAKFHFRAKIDQLH